MNLKFATVELFIRMLIIIDGFTSNIIIFDVFLDLALMNTKATIYRALSAN